MARVERLPEGASDLQWEAVTYRRLPVVGQGGESTLRVTWSGELLDADDPDAPNSAGQTVTVRRTVYADTILL
jgi:hypothetical protein